ncbi:MAG TPA: hypothetical protein GXZ74_06455 [Tissierellia bacterium]|nr:hypothetical protein [Tissierellia bacterium]
MATWIAHLRVAEALKQAWPIEDACAFYVGNLGPDCGEPNEDWSSFEPPSEVSHWSTSYKKSTIDPERFYQAYLREDWNDFYLGYYIHLQCDLIWDRLIGRVARQRFQAEFQSTPGFIWTIKEDWYAHDNHFVIAHPDWEPLRIICQLDEFPNTYLDYYPEHAFTRQMAYICSFYRSYAFHDREFLYLSKEEYDDYIATATAEIHQILLLKANRR